MRHIYLTVKSFRVMAATCIAAIFAVTNSALALPVDTYTSSSVLSNGRWIKISVESAGMHRISAATLRSWGFSDISRVRIYGYGGKRLSDVLSESEYIDDLPQVQIANTSDAIYFYAEGTVSWDRSTSGYYTHSLNPFSLSGYYFITESSEPGRDIPEEGSATLSDDALTTFRERLYHEENQIALNQSGHNRYGEDFLYTATRTFPFSIIDKVEDTKIWMRCKVAVSSSSSTSFSFTANGTAIEPSVTNRVSPISASQKNVASTGTFSKTFDISGNSLSLGIQFNSSGVVTASHLDAIDINYTRSIKLHEGMLRFRSDGTTTGVRLANANASTHVWDITDPLSIKSMKTTVTGNDIAWINAYTGRREYIAWNENASFPEPKYVCTVANQNLHASTTEYPDMVIFTANEWRTQAEQIADIHRNSEDRLNVSVVVQDYVFNEFSSGTRDVNAFRRMLKMIYDRGNEAGHPLKYVLFFGRATFDNLGITSQMAGLEHPVMPTWQTDESLLDATGSYTTDDIFAYLEDNSGQTQNSDRYCISVGRIPARSATEATEYVAKLKEYISSPRKSEWKNQVMLLADNGDAGTHMDQSEAMETELRSDESGQNMFYNKVYVDAFKIIGGICEGGRDRMYRLLDEGVLWWNYIGHGNISSLTAEKMLSVTDINNMYLRHYPVLFAATCSFLQWDGNARSGAEMLFFNRRGGVISAVSATRSALISANGVLAKAVGSEAFARNDDGRFNTIGEIFRRAKNRVSANENKRLYVLMGDPAMRFDSPDHRVKLETINGQAIGGDEDIAIMARQYVTLTGTIYDCTGQKLDNFNGTLSFTLYDAEYSTTSLGEDTSDTEGKSVIFEEQGGKLYAGRDTIINGEFSLRFAMPLEISDNYRPAALNMYAYSQATGLEAAGCERNFYVYGYDDTAEPDNNPPVIDYAYLNHPSFEQGATVNDSPMFLASVTDDVGINMSTAGIGHQMTLKLDESKSYNDVSLYYTPASDGSPSGTIAYPMSDLASGNHSLTFRVWDTSGNSASRTIEFFVDPEAAPSVFDIFTDANPASTEANFYISHNRPDAIVTVTLSIYNMLGRLVWTSAVTDRSDMFLSAPVTWDLCDMAGHRVNRGIYLYRATISENGMEQQSKAKRIAVTGH